MRGRLTGEWTKEGGGELAAGGTTAFPLAADAVSSDIQVIGRCAQILRLFTMPGRALRVADVADVGLQRSTAHRYLSSLANTGFLERTADGGYRTGPLLVQLGTVALGGLRVLEVSGPYLQRLAEEAHETVVLAVWGGLGPVVAQVYEDLDKLVNISVRVGSALPLDAAQAQVFLAFLSDRSTVSRLLAQLPPSGRRQREISVDRVRRDGLCISSRVIDGIRAVAVPVFDDGGAICATVAIVGTVSSVPEDPRAGVVQALVGTAGALSQQMGHTGPRALDPSG